MKALNPREAVRQAHPAHGRPAMTMLADSADARLLVFRFEPGQSLPPHRNGSTVIVTVLEGEGVFSGAEGEQQCAAGQVMTYAPSELHGIRALDAELLVLVTIAPSPGSR